MATAVHNEAVEVAQPSAVRRLFALRNPPPPTLKKLLGALGVIIVLAVWWLLTLGATPEARIVSPVVLPSPLEVLRSIPALFGERALLQSAAATLQRVITGFGLAIIVGVPFGIVAGAYRVFDAITGPLSVFLRNIPIAVLIPLTILWFGIDETQKTMFIFISTVPFVFFDTVRAITSVPERYVETAQTLGATQRQVIAKVLIPLALPDIYGGLRNLFGLAFGYIMLAELVNAQHGLGFLLMTSQRRGLTEHIFAILIVIGLMAYGIDRLLYFFQRGLFPYKAATE
jgi:ABC-type nitrate/sulfonate/bicarbonate transport system permease component